MIVFFV